MKILKTFLFLIIITVLVSCDIKDPVEGIEVRLNTINRETLVTGYLYDASNGQSVDQNVTISFSGQNTQYIVDETNDPVSEFSVKGGFFNFAVKDGIVIDQNNPFKVVVTIKSPGYLDIECPVVLNSKGTQGVTFFLAKQSDFNDDITVNTIPSGTAGGTGTVQDTTKVTSGDGTEITIPGGTNLTTSGGTPLQGGLTTNITTVVYNQNNTSIQPPNTGVGGGQAMAPLMSIKIEVKDNSGNIATNLTQPIEASIPIEDNLTNPVTGSSLQAGDSIPIWYLTSDGNYSRSYPSAYVNISGSSFSKVSSGKGNLSLHAFIKFINSFLGFSAPVCTPKFIVSNPRPGFAIQVFFGLSNLYAPVAYSGQINNNEISLRPEHFPSLGYSVMIKSGANPLTGQGGWTYATVQWNTSSCGNQVPVTLNYPLESIQANVKITGVCTSRDPLVRAYPSITFNYKKQGTGTWLQGSLANGLSTIAGLEPNTIYEAKATYRDKEAAVDIHVNSATDFTVLAGANQGSLLRAEVKGTSTENGITHVNMEIDIDLKDDCD